MIAAVEQLLADFFDVAVNRETLIHSNHNHVRRETHQGQDYWVHRKGALSAATDEPGVIPGSMGSASFHVVGRGEESRYAQVRMVRVVSLAVVKRRRRSMSDVWSEKCTECGSTTVMLHCYATKRIGVQRRPCRDARHSGN